LSYVRETTVELAAERGGYDEVALFHKRKPQRVLILVLCIGIYTILEDVMRTR
jgi:hypothetical protein